MAYATLAELAAHTNAAPESDDDRLLQRASDLLDAFLIGAVYAVDDNGLPTDAAAIAAFRDAVCAQVEWWHATGDDLGVEGPWQEITLGPARMVRSATTGGSNQGRMAPRALDILRLAGTQPRPILR